MSNRSIPNQIWRAIYPPLIYIGLSFFVTVAAVFMYSIGLGIRIAASGEARTPGVIAGQVQAFVMNYQLLLLAVSGAIGILIFSLMWREIMKRLKRYDHDGMNPMKAIFTALGCMGLCCVIMSVIDIAGLVNYFPSYKVVARVLSSGGFIMQILALGIVVPIAEELCFRGVVLNRLLSWIPTWAAVLMSSVLFGVIHLNILQGLYALVIGLVFSLLYIRYRNIWAPIIGHMAFNLTSVLLLAYINFRGIKEINVLILLVPSGLVMAACVWVLLKHTQAAVLVQEPEPEPEPMSPYPDSGSAE